MIKPRIGNENVKKLLVKQINEALEKRAQQDKDDYPNTIGAQAKGGVSTNKSINVVPSTHAARVSGLNTQKEVNNQMDLQRRAIADRTTKKGGLLTGGRMSGGLLTGGLLTGGVKPKPKPKAKKSDGNPWFQHVKAWAQANGMSYRDALKSPECKAAYAYKH